MFSVVVPPLPHLLFLLLFSSNISRNNGRVMTETMAGLTNVVTDSGTTAGTGRAAILSKGRVRVRFLCYEHPLGSKSNVHVPARL